MLDATQLRTHVPCYATACARTVGVGVVACVVFAHMVDAVHMFHATQLHVLLLFVYCTDGVGVGGVGVVACAALAHMLDATQLHVLTHAHMLAAISLRGSDRRFNHRMEQYVYSYMWPFNTETGGSSSESCASNNEKANKDHKIIFFFGGS